MAQLLVRDVEEEVVRALKLRAARQGRSAEAEHRELLKAALLPGRRKSFKAFLASMPEAGHDLPSRSRSKPRRVRL